MDAVKKTDENFEIGDRVWVNDYPRKGDSIIAVICGPVVQTNFGEVIPAQYTQDTSYPEYFSIQRIEMHTKRGPK